MLNSMSEDIGCRYSLASSKLRDLLRPLAQSVQSGDSSSQQQSPDVEMKIKQAYQVGLMRFH